MSNKFHITHLYPKEMSIYGDQGNVIAIQRMLDKLGWEWIYQTVEVGQKLPKFNDFIFIGGGQDQDQYSITDDLLTKKFELKKLVEDGVSLLAICGGYQLLGQEFIDAKGQEMEGLGIFPVKTKALNGSVKSRCVGNIVVDCEFLRTKLVGFENHGGQTYFTRLANPLGKVIVGFGNNFVEKTEGCVHKNAIGTYLHGSCLPKNPSLTMWFINQALELKKQKNQIGYGLYYMVKKAEPDNSIATHVNISLAKRFSS
jgi:lipid II isoglutaminyl synthase (glutamine-hydrolysing)